MPVKLGKPLGLSDVQLEALAVVTPTDVLNAESLWERSVPVFYTTLLLASILGSNADNSLSLFAWDAVNGGYVYLPSGRKVGVLEIRRNAIEPLITQSKANQRGISARLQARQIHLADWQRQMIESIKTTQVAATLAANGGINNTTESDKSEIALIVLALLLLLGGFADDIAIGKTPLNGLIGVRSDLYAGAARGAYEQMNGYFNKAYLGKTEERRFLGDADHCHDEPDMIGCPNLAKLGWVPIGTLPKLGQTPCRSNCRCFFRYR